MRRFEARWFSPVTLQVRECNRKRCLIRLKSVSFSTKHAASAENNAALAGDWKACQRRHTEKLLLVFA